MRSIPRRFLLGGATPTGVRAAISTRFGTYDVDDEAIVLIHWDNGTNSVVESGWWQPHAAGMEADTEVYGTAGYARVFAFTEPPNDTYEHCPQSMYTAQMNEFLDAIIEGRPPSPTGEDGLIVMQVLDEAYRSAGAAR